eukprot:Gregarina_sp_Poly_1__3825@NODE_213_length_11325_cov_357_800853_g189_i0_p1_GENE_NODE_213_length_11325_cov_357_800853_g189_i0NODE_213_length_11325_cov_357_800853_g189_i0_p1_ORF_typecomplete_len748_score114_25rRNA_procarch/PF13234_6/6_6e03rRNA_procarch/PF13234_6/0_64_NODE_213_length_11325_cov_357_800853_g189_i035915834
MDFKYTDVKRNVLIQSDLSSIGVFDIADADTSLLLDPENCVWQVSTDKIFQEESLEEDKKLVAKNVDGFRRRSLGGPLLLQKQSQRIEFGEFRTSGSITCVQPHFFVYIDDQGERCLFPTSTIINDDVLSNYRMCAVIEGQRYLFLSQDGRGHVINIQSGESESQISLDLGFERDFSDDDETEVAAVCLFPLTERVIGLLTFILDDNREIQETCTQFYFFDDGLNPRLATSISNMFNFDIDASDDLDEQALSCLLKVCPLPLGNQFLIYSPRSPAAKLITLTGPDVLKFEETSELHVNYKMDPQNMFDINYGFCHIVSRDSNTIMAVQTDGTVMVANAIPVEVPSPTCGNPSDARLSSEIDVPPSPRKRESHAHVTQSYSICEDDEDEIEQTGSSFSQISEESVMPDVMLQVEKSVEEILNEIRATALCQEDDIKEIWISICNTWAKFENRIKELEVMRSNQNWSGIDDRHHKFAKLEETVELGNERLAQTLQPPESCELKSQTELLLSKTHSVQAELNSLSDFFDSVVLASGSEIKDLTDVKTALFNLSELLAKNDKIQNVRSVLNAVERLRSVLTHIDSLNNRIANLNKQERSFVPFNKDKATDTGNMPPAQPRRWKRFELPTAISTVQSPTDIKQISPADFLLTTEGSKFLTEVGRLTNVLQDNIKKYDVTLTAMRCRSSPMPSSRSSNYNTMSRTSIDDCQEDVKAQQGDERRKTFYCNVVFGSQSLMNRRRQQIELWKTRRM